MRNIMFEELFITPLGPSLMLEEFYEIYFMDNIDGLFFINGVTICK